MSKMKVHMRMLPIHIQFTYFLCSNLCIHRPLSSSITSAWVLKWQSGTKLFSLLPHRVTKCSSTKLESLLMKMLSEMGKQFCKVLHLDSIRLRLYTWRRTRLETTKILLIHLVRDISLDVLRGVKLLHFWSRYVSAAQRRLDHLCHLVYTS